MVPSVFESITIAQNTVITQCTIQHLRGASNLKCFTLKKVVFQQMYKLSDLPIDKSPVLQYLDLTGSTGLLVLPDAHPSETGVYSFSPVPFSWSALTKLGVLIFRDMGLSARFIDNLIIGLAQVSAQGLGSAATVKKIYLDGANAAPTALSASHLAQLQSLGFEVYHSDVAKSAEMEPNPCCGGDCVDCNQVTPPTLITVNAAVAGTMDNGQYQAVTVNVPGLVLGGNNNVQLATDISALVAAGWVVSHQVIANDTLNVIIENQTGEDGQVFPTIQYNIYIFQ